MEIYKASLDKTARILTVFVLTIVMGLWIPVFISHIPMGLLIQQIILSVVIIYCYLYSVKSYQITDESLIIKRPIPIFDKKILLSDIEGVRLLTKEDAAFTIRTFGNGGFFGYTGYYANSKLGNFKMYATNRKNKVFLILRDAAEIVISPDDPAMVENLQKHFQKFK